MREKVSKTKEIETDVVVVGYGGAGAAAAITAHDSGARVIILEKTTEGGGNTRLAAGNWQNPRSIKAVDHIKTVCREMTDGEIIQVWVENATKNKEWIEEIGGETEPGTVLDVSHPCITSVWFPNVIGAEDIACFRIKQSGDEYRGETFWKLLSTNVERRGIRIMTSTPAKGLITNGKGEVIGVVAEKEEQKISIKAKRAVILTCGGFEYNEAMKNTFLPCKPIYPLGHQGNTGDGVRIAQEVGAALWHMTNFSGAFVFKTPEYEAGLPTRIFGDRFIYVNRDGRRFINETALLLEDAWRAISYFNGNRRRYPNIPVYAIFDNITRRRGPLHPHHSRITGDYRWSLDNSKEVAKGWIKRGKTIRELAQRISLDEFALENTVTKYNEYCQLSSDPDFGRSRETLDPIVAPPYYAIELWPGLINTLGGPRRDKEARVLDTASKPIPRLYSAGELGSIWVLLPARGCNVGGCLAFGRIAGRNAAAEKPWG